jgi:hypothetical protein
VKVTKHPSGTYEIIEVPNRLKEKVGGGAGLPDEVLDRAEAQVESWAEDYRSAVRQDLASLRKFLRTAENDPHSDSRGVQLESMYRVAHDMKGQGSSFGYPLVTEIAGALCRYLGLPPQIETIDLAVCAIHVDALHVIIQNGVTGDGGELGQKVLDGIERVVEKSAAHTGQSPT